MARLVEQGIYVTHPTLRMGWPDRPRQEAGGEIRICGDYKMTVNCAAESDTYPVPETEDLLATLNGGKKFSKLDLRQAYE